MDEKIKRALRSRISSGNDLVFEYGDKVFFKEKEVNKKYKENWSGPASVLCIKGKVVFLKYGNMLRRVHCSKVVKAKNEYLDNRESDTADENLESPKGNEQNMKNPQQEEVTAKDETNLDRNAEETSKRPSLR